MLAAGVNSPLLFGRQLWSETRIALFQQSVDARSETHQARGHQRIRLDDIVGDVVEVELADEVRGDRVVAAEHDVRRGHPVLHVVRCFPEAFSEPVQMGPEPLEVPPGDVGYELHVLRHGPPAIQDRCQVDPRNLQVHFLGCVDAQLKVRGHRVEIQAVNHLTRRAGHPRGHTHIQ